MNWIYKRDKDKPKEAPLKYWIIDYSFYMWNGSFAYKRPCKCANAQGKGKPDNPGEHGRDNAAQKQRENPGKGSKGGDSWEDSIKDEFDEKDKDKDKDKNRKNKEK